MSLPGVFVGESSVPHESCISCGDVVGRLQAHDRLHMQTIIADARPCSTLQICSHVPPSWSFEHAFGNNCHVQSADLRD
jgi:hypothetical protein